MTTTTSSPLVTLGIPTYNGNTRVLKALSSIWSQRYPNLDIIISDNASTDNTQQLCEEVCTAHPGIRYFRQKDNLGILGNFEFVLEKAVGKYFMWVADDDEFEPGALLKYIDFLEKNPSYALVSGRIQYWQGDQPVFAEKDFTLEHGSSAWRVVQYYGRVVHGGMFHGMMRRELAQRVPTRKVFGNDYHFAASLAYLGKMKNFDFTGYNKRLGGSSKNMKKYAKSLGESDFAANFPHLKMSFDAFAEVLYRSPVYADMFFLSRFFLGTASGTSILYRYYVRIYPFVIGGRIKRFLKNIFQSGSDNMIRKTERA